MKDWNNEPEISLYTDGGAEPNPGNGGFGVILTYKGISKEFYQGFELTTNNRMELMGIIFGLEKLKTTSVVDVFSDSRYVIDAIEKGWAEKWRANNWMRTKKEKAMNSDLWERLLTILEKHTVHFHWVKGHSGHPENERCDALATLALQGDNLKEDAGYEANNVVLKEAKEKALRKIEEAGTPCRKCDTPVIKKTPKKRKVKDKQSYYYEYYMYCPNCKTMYMVEDAKREITRPTLFS
ncbi:MAG: ribonuclease HI [Altibacter sp.]|uniref:ribonuclease HI n=1 Tax=Altibacter sp. TaxID=2024823 RepID=UPI000C929242|nr:ribonuclease HI [Altibacter sp.]MAP55113.1 ribonuclease HI [Altibacter sp.]